MALKDEPAFERAITVAEAAADLARETSIILATHMVRCEGASKMLQRDITDVAADFKAARTEALCWRLRNTEEIANLRKLLVRSFWYGGCAIAALATIQLFGLENAFQIYKNLRP